MNVKNERLFYLGLLNTLRETNLDVIAKTKLFGMRSKCFHLSIRILSLQACVTKSISQKFQKWHGDLKISYFLYLKDLSNSSDPGTAFIEIVHRKVLIIGR